jgi:hypothetical protein
MDIFTLVRDVEKVIEELRGQYGNFTLALLYNSTLQSDWGWNLIVSAPWLDRMGLGEATRLVVNAVYQGANVENKSRVSRVTVLKTSDPFVREMTNLYPVAPGTRMPVQQLFAGDTAGSGFILYSQRAA